MMEGFTKSLILEHFNDSKEFFQWKLIKVTEKRFVSIFFTSFEIYLELCSLQEFNIWHLSTENSFWNEQKTQWT